MPTMGPDEAATSAIAGLQAFVNLRPLTVTDAFEAMAVFEDGCPEEFQDIVEGENRVLQWYTEGCTTSGGLTVRGSGRFEKYVDRVDGDRTSSGVSLSAEGGTFRLEQGNRWLQYSGYMGVDKGTYASGGDDGYFGFTGEASADAMTAMGAPLLDGSVTAQGELYAGIFPGYKAIGGSGALTGNVLGASRAMAFDNVLAVAEVCGAEPAGALSVRDDRGFWHDIVFDAAEEVNDEYEWDPALCDGCGEYLAGGMESGTACIPGNAVASLLNWDQVPW
jgi:hypothetical protein